jgi:hypothetical protein
MAPRIGRFSLFGAVACVLAATGSACDKPSGVQSAPSATEAAAPTPSGACSAGASSPACSAQAQSAVTRVVFIGKKEACDCTRKAIDTSWKALEAVLAAGHAMPVERLEVDTDPEKVRTYQMMKPFMALPAIYLLDVNDGVVEMLQGEVSEAQVTEALAGRVASIQVVGRKSEEVVP